MDNWQVGDLALCVKGDAHIPCGAVHTVSEVLLAARVGLRFYDFPISARINYSPATAWWDARAFRKVRPLSDEERASFLADIRVPEDA